MNKKKILFAIFIYTIFPLSSVFMKMASEYEDLIINRSSRNFFTIMAKIIEERRFSKSIYF